MASPSSDNEQRLIIEPASFLRILILSNGGLWLIILYNIIIGFCCFYLKWRPDPNLNPFLLTLIIVLLCFGIWENILRYNAPAQKLQMLGYKVNLGHIKLLHVSWNIKLEDLK